MTKINLKPIYGTTYMAFTLNQITEEITTVEQQLSQMAKHRQVLNRKLRVLKDELTLLSPQTTMNQEEEVQKLKDGKSMEEIGGDILLNQLGIDEDIETSGFSTMTQEDIQQAIDGDRQEREAIQSEPTAKSTKKVGKNPVVNLDSDIPYKD